MVVTCSVSALLNTFGPGLDQATLLPASLWNRVGFMPATALNSVRVPPGFSTVACTPVPRSS